MQVEADSAKGASWRVATVHQTKPSRSQFFSSLTVRLSLSTGRDPTFLIDFI